MCRRRLRGKGVSNVRQAGRGFVEREFRWEQHGARLATIYASIQGAH